MKLILVRSAIAACVADLLLCGGAWPAPPAAPPRFLSSAGRAAYERAWAPARGILSPPSAEPGLVRSAPLPYRISPALPSGTASPFVNQRLNDPTGDLPNETQSETAVTLQGSKVIAGFNDSRGFTSGTISSYAYSADGGLTWTDGGDLPLQGLGTGEQLYGDPGLCSNRQGHFWYSSIYIQPGGVSAVGVNRGTFGAAAPAWSAPVAVAPTVPDFLDKPECACDPDSDFVYVVWTRFIHGGGEGQIEFARSVDGGLSFGAPVIMQPLITGDNVQAGWIVVDDQKGVNVFWEDGLGMPLGTAQHSSLLHRRSTDNGTTFGATDTVATVHANWYAGPPGFNRRDGFFEFPNAAADLSAGPNRGTIYVVWNESADPIFSGVPPVPQAEVEPNDTITQADSIAIPIRVTATLSSTSDVDWFKFQGTAGQMVRLLVTPAATLWPRLRLTDSPAGDTLLVDSSVGTGVQANGWVTLPSSGTYTIQVQAGGTTSGSYTMDVETVAPGPGSIARDHRDAVVTVTHDYGAHWSPPAVLNDDAPLFDQAMPMVSVDSLGLAHAFWYDRRNDGLRGGRADVYYARSSNGGQSWSTNLRVTDQATTWQVPSRAAPNFGDYSTSASAGNATFPVWADGRFGSPDVFSARVSSGFTLSCAHDTTVAAGDTIALFYPVTNLSPFPETFVYDIADSDGILAAVHDSLSLAPGAAGGVTYVAAIPDTVKKNQDDPIGLTGRFRSASFAASRCRTVVHVQGTLVAVEGEGGEWRLARPVPNPAAGNVHIGFSLARPANAVLRMHSVSGRVVRTLVRGSLAGGTHEVVWDGRDESGRKVAPGVYFCRLQAGAWSSERKLVVIEP